MIEFIKWLKLKPYLLNLNQPKARQSKLLKKKRERILLNSINVLIYVSQEFRTSVLSGILEVLAVYIFQNAKRSLPVFGLEHQVAEDLGRVPSLTYSFMNVIAGENIHLNPLFLCFTKLHLMLASALSISISFTS